jgi:hypothetical protein
METKTANSRTRSISILLIGAALIAGIMMTFGAGPSGASTKGTLGVRMADMSTSLPVGFSQAPALPASMAARWDSAYAYFPPADQVVVFGGAPSEAGQRYHNDTFIYSDGAWTNGPAAPTDLAPRGGAAMAYDPAIGKIVLWGGADATWPYTFRGTWLWDGSAWSHGPTAPAAMAPRVGAQMVFDPDINKIVLFGGSGMTGYNDTWLFDGTSWSAGPAAPADMQPRTFFGMTYDPDLHRVVLLGGDNDYDVWLFDGTSWSAGPTLPRTFRGTLRTHLAYDPDINAVVTFGGTASGTEQDDLWILQGGTWKLIPKASGTEIRPEGRMDSAILWHPAYDAFMVFGGRTGEEAGNDVFADTWFFREITPSIPSVTLSPKAPYIYQNVKATIGAAQGGYGPLAYTYTWLVNGQRVQSSSLKAALPRTYLHVNDTVQLKVQVTDALNLSSAVVASNIITVANRAPAANTGSLTPLPAYTDSTITARAATTSDPDGDSVTLHYAWMVNGNDVAGNDQPTLSSSHFKAGDQVEARITPVDEWGMSGNALTPSLVVKPHLFAGSGKPGGTVKVSGQGYQANEKAAIYLDAPTGLKLGTLTADATGAWPSTSIPLPASVPGGSHLVYGIGQTSGTTGSATMTVTSAAALSPGTLAAGDTVTVSGVGFMAGETVSVTFPGQAPAQTAANDQGNVSLTMTSPDEPAPGGVVQVAGAAGTLSLSFTTRAVASFPDTAAPGAAVPVSFTGYGASEVVHVKVDGSTTIQSFTADPAGSFEGMLVVSATFGTHSLTVQGATSGMAVTHNMRLPTSLTLSQASGPQGTEVTVTCGPGWIPGEVVHLSWAGAQVADAVADIEGSVSITFTIPKHAPGNVTITLSDDILKLSASQSFQVTS